MTPGCSVKPFFCPTTDPRYSYNNVNSENYANPNSPHSYYRCINDVPYLVVSLCLVAVQFLAYDRYFLIKTMKFTLALIGLRSFGVQL